MQIDELALDVGRLRRYVKPETSLEHLVNRIADRVELVDAMVRTTAAEIYRAMREAGWEDETALKIALAETDRRTRRFRSLLRVTQ